MTLAALIGAPEPARGSDGASLLVSPLAPLARRELPVGQVPETGPVWRWYSRRPPNVRLDTGPFCPLCDFLLDQARDGWRCTRPSCLAGWDFRGERGRWEAR
jgi:hypothetical protein